MIGAGERSRIEPGPRRALALARIDRTLSATLAAIVIGTVLGFGGAAWWSPAAIAIGLAVLMVAFLARSCISGRWFVLKSPLTGLGCLAVGLAAFQSAPLPPAIASALSPLARAIHVSGATPGLPATGEATTNERQVTTESSSRSPITLDRPATLRWLLGALACLGALLVASHHADRVERLRIVWGSVVLAFLLQAGIIAVQVAGGAEGLYGFLEPGHGPRWGPTLVDAANAPGSATFREVATRSPTPHPWAFPRPRPVPLLGTMLGGPGSLLALGSLGLPLALALTLQLMAPRGSREGLRARLAESGQGSLLVLLILATIVAAGEIGLVAGPILAIPFAVVVAGVGLVSLVGSGLGWKGLAITLAVLGAIGGGVAVGDAMGGLPRRGGLTPWRIDPDAAASARSVAGAIARDFPTVGVGLGAFAAVEPYYKDGDASTNTAMSSLLQWRAEAGHAGLALLGIGCLWGLVRLPGAFRRVGSADRALAAGLVGTIVLFGAISAVHATVELMAVALAASAVAGTANRWLAGGTDLFVERE